MGNSDDAFALVGARAREAPPLPEPPLRRRPPRGALFLAAIALGCLFAGMLSGCEPGKFYLDHLNEAPNRIFYFGTDALGRDLFSTLWQGGRISLTVGMVAMAVETALGVAYGCVSGVFERADAYLMRAAELLSSVPRLLLLLFLLSAQGEQTPVSIALAIGATGWMNLARVVRGEVRRIRRSDYVQAARCMGADLFYIARRHLLPNLLPNVSFMIVSGFGAAVAMESTLSFLGLGLPLDIPSWGSMLSLANRALLTGAWWVVVFPGALLTATLLSIMELGEALRGKAERRCSYL